MINCSKLLIIYNPNAMRGKIEEVMPKIKERLSLRYSTVDAVYTLLTNTAEDIAYKNANKYDIIVSCGGDGTLHEVINGIKKSGFSPIVAILPFGTCNDVARTLKIPFDLDEAIDTILRLNTTKYDLLFDGKDYTVYTMATGFLTPVSYNTPNKAKRKFGRLAYFCAGIKYFFRMKALPITVTIDSERIHDKFIYFMIINGEYAGGMRLNPNDNISNNKAKVILIRYKNWFASLMTFIKLFIFGEKSIKNSKRSIVREASIIEIENHSNESFTVDGEKIKFLKKSIDVNQSIDIVTK